MLIYRTNLTLNAPPTNIFNFITNIFNLSNWTILDSTSTQLAVKTEKTSTNYVYVVFKLDEYDGEYEITCTIYPKWDDVLKQGVAAGAVSSYTFKCGEVSTDFTVWIDDEYFFIATYANNTNPEAYSVNKDFFGVFFIETIDSKMGNKIGSTLTSDCLSGSEVAYVDDIGFVSNDPRNYCITSAGNGTEIVTVSDLWTVQKKVGFSSAVNYDYVTGAEIGFYSNSACMLTNCNGDSNQKSIQLLCMPGIDWSFDMSIIPNINNPFIECSKYNPIYNKSVICPSIIIDENMNNIIGLCNVLCICYDNVEVVDSKYDNVFGVGESVTSTVTSFSSDTISDSSQAWNNDEFVDKYLVILNDTNDISIRKIESNTFDTISTTIPFEFTIENGFSYKICDDVYRQAFEQFIIQDNGTMVVLEEPESEPLVLLLHMDGVDGTSDFIDSSSYEHTIICNGTLPPILDTDIKKLGTASGLFDQNDQFLSISPSIPSFSFGNNDITFDFWYMTEFFDVVFIEQRDLVNSSFYAFYATESSIQFDMYNEDEDYGAEYYCYFEFEADTWYQIALVRNGTDLLLFISGVYQAWTFVNEFIETKSFPVMTGNIMINQRIIGN